MNPAIEVALLRKSFPGRDGMSRAVLSDLDLAVGAGEFLCIIGPSGCGKSTLAKAFLNRVTEAGAAVLSGHCYEQESVPYKAFDEVIDALEKYLISLDKLEVAAILPRDACLLARLFQVLRQLDRRLLIVWTTRIF